MIDFEELEKASRSNLLTQWRELNKSLIEWKANEFPIGAVVYVKADQYHGFGIATRWDGCPADRLAVWLGNGNVWLYSLEHCNRVRVSPKSPKVVRQMKLKFHGYKLLSTCQSGYRK